MPWREIHSGAPPLWPCAGQGCSAAAARGTTRAECAWARPHRPRAATTRRADTRIWINLLRRGAATAEQVVAADSTPSWSTVTNPILPTHTSLGATRFRRCASVRLSTIQVKPTTLYLAVVTRKPEMSQPFVHNTSRRNSAPPLEEDKTSYRPIELAKSFDEIRIVEVAVSDLHNCPSLRCVGDRTTQVVTPNQ